MNFEFHRYKLLKLPKRGLWKGNCDFTDLPSPEKSIVVSITGVLLKSIDNFDSSNSSFFVSIVLCKRKKTRD